MTSRANQLALFNTEPQNKVVNVASVPKLSPFRYPGGKTWLVPRIREWLRMQPDIFIEPFAGGGIVGLTVAAEKLAGRVVMAEIDEQVAAVWKAILVDRDAEWLADKIEGFDLTLETLKATLAKAARSNRERAFQTILKNRTYRGGILAEGSAPVRQGENGRGIKSRWYAQTLKKRIMEIDELRNHIDFIEGDGLSVIRRYAKRPRAAFFIDPPYTAGGKKAGKRLYNCYDLDHPALFKLMDEAAGDFLMTYDNAEEVRALARGHNFDVEPVAMKNTHHAAMTELLISRDLDWARR
jgi:DNA adenine methylase